MTDALHPLPSHELSKRRHTLAPEIETAFHELMEAIWVAAEMRAGGTYAHSNIALATLEETERRAPDRS
jgi:hypothetical protein